MSFLSFGWEILSTRNILAKFQARSSFSVKIMVVSCFSLFWPILTLIVTTYGVLICHGVIGSTLHLEFELGSGVYTNTHKHIMLNMCASLKTNKVPICCARLLYYSYTEWPSKKVQLLNFTLAQKLTIFVSQFPSQILVSMWNLALIVHCARCLSNNKGNPSIINNFQMPTLTIEPDSDAILNPSQFWLCLFYELDFYFIVNRNNSVLGN